MIRIAALAVVAAACGDHKDQDLLGDGGHPPFLR